MPHPSREIGHIVTGQGKGLLFAAVSQGGAGTTQLVAAVTGQRIKVVNYVVVMSAGGTLKFVDGAGDLTGAMALAANGGVSASGEASCPWFQTGVGSALSVTTTGGAAMGHLSYFCE